MNMTIRGFEEISFPSPKLKRKPNRKVVFNYDIPILSLSKGDEYDVKYDYDGRAFIEIKRRKLYLTSERNRCGAYKTFELKEDYDPQMFGQDEI